MLGTNVKEKDLGVTIRVSDRVVCLFAAKKSKKSLIYDFFNFFDFRFFYSLIYMNLTQIIVYKHRDQQSFVCFLIQKHKLHTLV